MSSPLPECSGEFAALPPGIHRASLADIHARFVKDAPLDSRERREQIFRAAELHISEVIRVFDGNHIRVWWGGSFITWKPWGTPSDADLAFLVPVTTRDRVIDERSLPLWTLGNVSGVLGANGPQFSTMKLQTGFGLTEGYVVNADNPAQIEIMRRQWSRVKGPDGEIIDGVQKGFVEVILDV